MRNGVHSQSPILEARAARADRTHRFVKRVCLPTIVLTVNVPGPEKNEPWVAAVMERGKRKILTHLAAHRCVARGEEACCSAAGPEWRAAFAGGGMDGRRLKYTAIDIETVHPIGRLLDIDVFDVNGASVDRSTLGIPPRRCLVCERPAHECARSANHPPAELRERINALVRDITTISF